MESTGKDSASAYLTVNDLEMLFPSRPRQVTESANPKWVARGPDWQVEFEVAERLDGKPFDDSDLESFASQKGNSSSFSEKPVSLAGYRGTLTSYLSHEKVTRVLQLMKGGRLVNINTIDLDGSEVGAEFIESIGGIADNMSRPPPQSEPIQSPIEQVSPAGAARLAEPSFSENISWLFQLAELQSIDRAVLIARWEFHRLTREVLAHVAWAANPPESSRIEGEKQLRNAGMSASEAARIMSLPPRDLQTWKRLAVILPSVSKLQGESPSKPAMQELSFHFLLGNMSAAAFIARFDTADPSYSSIQMVRSMIGQLGSEGMEFVAQSTANAVVARALIPVLLDPRRRAEAKQRIAAPSSEELNWAFVLGFQMMNDPSILASLKLNHFAAQLSAVQGSAERLHPLAKAVVAELSMRTVQLGACFELGFDLCIAVLVGRNQPLPASTLSELAEVAKTAGLSAGRVDALIGGLRQAPLHKHEAIVADFWKGALDFSEDGVPLTLPSPSAAEVISFLSQNYQAIQFGLLGVRGIISGALACAPISDAEWERVERGEGNLARLPVEVASAVGEHAFVWHERGEHAAAERVFLALSYLNPTDGYLHGMLGVLAAKLGREESAINQFGLAIKFDSKLIFAFVNRAELLLQQGNFEAGMDDLKSAIKLDQTGTDPHARRARALAATVVKTLDSVLAKKKAEAKRKAEAK